MKRARVLLADSHQIMLDGLRDLLEPNCQVVGMVDDADALLQAAETHQPDLAVVDISLPVANGDTVARLLRDRYPHLKLIVISVHDEATAVTETLATGAEGFVLKRSAASDLMPAVRAVLRGDRYVSPAVQRQQRKQTAGTISTPLTKTSN